MRMTSWIPVSVLLLGAAVSLLAHRALVSPAPRGGGAGAGFHDVVSSADIALSDDPSDEDNPLFGGEDEEDPWLPGIRSAGGADGAAYDPFSLPRATLRRGPDLDELMRDVGVDIRGLGQSSGGIASLDDVTNGLAEQAATGSREEPRRVSSWGMGVAGGGNGGALEDVPSSGGLSGRATGIPPASALQPSAGAYFGDGRPADPLRTFDAQWKAIMQDMERSLLPQVETMVFPKDWLDEIRRDADRARGIGANPESGDLDDPSEDELRARAAAAESLRARVVARMREAIDTFLQRGGAGFDDGAFDASVAAYESALAVLAHGPRGVDWTRLRDEARTGLGQARQARRLARVQDKLAAVEAGLHSLSAEEERGLLAERAQLQRERIDATTWRRAAARPHSTRLTVGDDAELPLEAMDVTVRIDGHRARVVIDTFFRNVHETRLAGTWQLRLPTGASPHYLAFGRTAVEAATFEPDPMVGVGELRAQRAGTWEAPKEARMVARVEAARAYQQTLVQRIDPALMEWAGAGVFSTQVFPLEPGALHHIVIAYDIDLQPDGDGLLHVLDLPEDVPSLDVVIQGDQTLRFHDPVVARLETRVAGAPAVLTGRSPRAGAVFATRVVPDLPETTARTNERAVFLVDVSASSNPERFNTWLALLRAILEQNRPTLREFAVAFFHVDTRWWREGFVANDAATVEALMADAHTLALEGATDLGRVLAAADGLAGDHDVFLLGDGAATWGETDRAAIAARLDPSHPVFGYVLPDGLADPAMLEELARRSGGAVFPLPAEADVPAVATAHAKRPWTLESVTLPGTSDLLIAGAPRTLFPGQALRIAGRGAPAAGAPLTLRVRQGDVRRTIQVPLGADRPSRLARRAYGEIAVARLEGLGAAAAATARAYAAHFRVVGAGCSLLMLESEADYVERGVQAVDETPVETQLASDVAGRVQAEAAATRADPKARFLARLEGWARHGERLGLRVPEALRAALATLPVTRFELPEAGLVATTRLRADVPEAVRAVIASGRADYDVISREAERRRAAHGTLDALVALSTLVELAPGDLVIARDVASSAAAFGHWADAIPLQMRVGDARPWELPTWLALARTLSQGGRDALAAPFFEAALGADAEGRFGGIQRVAALDYARCLERLAKAWDDGIARFASERLPHVREVLAMTEADLVVVIEWNTDRTDVDLHVTDPEGEVCYYEHPQTKMGGTLSRDVTEGYGPELFVLPRAAAGLYRVEVKYFASDTLRTAARSKVRARIIQDFGRPSERAEDVLLLLQSAEEKQLVRTVER